MAAMGRVALMVRLSEARTYQTLTKEAPRPANRCSCGS